jgi:hypothetical protein
MQILLSLLPSAGCKPLKNNGSERAGFILGANNIVNLDSKTVNEVPKIATDAAVMIATTLEKNSIKFCSGSLIEPALGGEKPRILTNHHCFAKESAAGDILPDLRSEACVKTVIYFGFNELTKYKPIRVNCLKGSLRTDPIGDLAVFELATDAPPGVVPFSLWPEDFPPPGRKAFIVHHPDVKENLHLPEGGDTPLPAASVTFEDCETRGLFPEDQWPLDPVLRFSFRHTCDLIHGSSGSALIDVDTNAILGTNWGGMKVNLASGQQIDNVSTKPGYIRNFVNDGADYRYQILAEGTAAKPENGKPGNPNIAASAKAAGGADPGKAFSIGKCGTISARTPIANTGMQFAVLLLFVGPLIFSLRTRQPGLQR